MKKKNKTKQKVKEVKRAIGRLKVPPPQIIPNKKRIQTWTDMAEFEDYDRGTYKGCDCC